MSTPRLLWPPHLTKRAPDGTVTLTGLAFAYNDKAGLGVAVIVPDGASLESYCRAHRIEIKQEAIRTGYMVLPPAAPPADLAPPAESTPMVQT